MLRLPHGVLPCNAEGARTQRLISCMGWQQYDCRADMECVCVLAR